MDEEVFFFWYAIPISTHGLCYVVYSVQKMAFLDESQSEEESGVFFFFEMPVALDNGTVGDRAIFQKFGTFFVPPIFFTSLSLRTGARMFLSCRWKVTPGGRKKNNPFPEP